MCVNVSLLIMSSVGFIEGSQQKKIEMSTDSDGINLDDHLT